MIAHGTASKYSNDACRCDDCWEAWRAYCFKRRRQRAAAIPDDIHGKVTTYQNHGCRCDECRAAQAANHKDYWAKRKDKT